MTSGLSAANDQFLAGLDNLDRQITQTTEQISSGLRVNHVSDSPSDVRDILELHYELGQVTQVQSNLQFVKGEVDTGESALESATQLLQNVGVLGTEGANGTQTADQRTILANQVQALLEQLVGVANTTYDGRYVFGGDADTQAPYEFQLNDTNSATPLTDASATRLIQDSTGTSFAVSKTAQEIFDLRNPDSTFASGNVFAAVNGLRVALANNDQAAIETAMSQIHDAQNHLSQELAFYGSVQNRVSSAIDIAQKFELNTQTAISSKQDADLPTLALNLTQATTNRQAALTAEAQLPKTSLFDFLP